MAGGASWELTSVSGLTASFFFVLGGASASSVVGPFRIPPSPFDRDLDGVACEAATQRDDISFGFGLYFYLYTMLYIEECFRFYRNDSRVAALGHH